MKAPAIKFCLVLLAACAVCSAQPVERNDAVKATIPSLAETYGSDILSSIPKLVKPQDDDIEEDPFDRFITSRSGKLRPKLVQDEEGESWADEAPGVMPAAKSNVLIRKKRCGGGYDDDDDGVDAVRRVRRTRRNRRRRRNRNRGGNQVRESRTNKKVKKTTVVRTVMKDGKVISQESVAPQASASTVVQSTHTATSGVVPAPTVVTQPAQVVQQPAVQVQPVQQPAQVVQQPASVQQLPAVQQQQTVATVPAGANLAVQGSVKLTA